MIVGVTSVLAGSLVFAQVGRGGSQWLTALADAQRTSWVRTDDKISVPRCRSPASNCSGRRSSRTGRAVSTVSGLGVTASGVTLFVPVSLVTGSSNNVYAIDNDLGYVVWERQFDVALPRTDGGLSRRDQRWRHAYREARRSGLDRSGVRRRAWSGRLSEPSGRARARRAGRTARRTCRSGPAAAGHRRSPGPRLPVVVAVRPRLRLRPRVLAGAAARRTIGSLDRRADVGAAQAEASLAPPALAT